MQGLPYHQGPAHLPLTHGHTSCLAWGCLPLHSHGSGSRIGTGAVLVLSVLAALAEVLMLASGRLPSPCIMLVPAHRCCLFLGIMLCACRMHCHVSCAVCCVFRWCLCVSCLSVRMHIRASIHLTMQAHQTVTIGVEWHLLETLKVATRRWDGLMEYWE